MRRSLLKEALESISKVRVPSELVVEVTVVDNDSSESARYAVSEIQKLYPFELTYLVEPNRGISKARNKAVDYAIKSQSEVLIFIDDDECVDEAWLESFFCCSKEVSDGTVLYGKVVSLFPEKTSEYFKPFYSKDYGDHGTSLKNCATNNTWIPLGIFKDLKIRFEERIGLSGGGDTLFFAEAYRRGVRIAYCPSAIVKEYIPESRLSVKWLSKRKFRAGITMAEVDCLNGKLKSTVAVNTLLSLCKYILKSACSFSKVERLSNYLKFVRSCGKLSGLLGFRIESYRSIDGAD